MSTGVARRRLKSTVQARTKPAGAVLDSDAVLAYLFREQGHQRVVQVLEEAIRDDAAVLIAAPNWAEVRYIVERKAGAAAWRETGRKLLALPIEVVACDRSRAEAAGQIKALRTMSLADCFAAALAMARDAARYTGDPEFREVAREIGIVWL